MKTLAFLCVALLILSGCYSQKRGVTEVYSWSPPSDDELKLRRFRQNELDLITAEIEKQIFVNEDLTHDIEDLQTSIRQTEVELAQLESQGAARIAKMEGKYKDLELNATELQGDRESVEEDIWKIKQDRLRRELSKKTYVAAIQLFKDGKLELSIANFRKALGLNPPGTLVDKMHFGISSAYFKLRKYPKAIDNLNILVNKFPKSDKWYISSVLLGWIYNSLGEKSKAIYVLENALQRNPPEAIQPLLDRLRRMVDEEEAKPAEG